MTDTPPIASDAPPAASEAPRHHPLQGDLTQGPILRTLLMFSIPMLLSNVLQTIQGSINAVWVGRLLGETALAATANANMVMFLMFAVIFGFGMATTVQLGQRFGARDVDGARRALGSGVGFCFGLSLIVAIAGWIYAAPLLDLLSTPEASKAEALAYLRVTFITIPFGSINMMVSMAMRGAGDSKTPMYAMILAAVIDIALNPLLIMGVGPFPELGIAGSALATAGANIVGMIYQFWRIYQQDLPMRLRGSEFAYLLPRSDELRYVLSKGLPMGAQMLLTSSAGLIMVGMVNHEGLDATAAYGASLQLWNYLQMPAFAISTAVSAMVAQSLGGGDHERVGRVTMVGMNVNLALTALLALLIVGLDRPMLALFLGGDSPALPIAEHIQLVCTASYVIMSITMILTGTMRAYGAVMAPLVIMFISVYPGRVGFYMLAYPHIRSEAVWWAYPVGSILSVALTVAYYRFGKWRNGFTGAS